MMSGTWRSAALSAADDDPARDTSSGIAGRIGAHVVGAVVHDESAPLGAEEGGRPLLQGHARSGELEVALAGGI